MEPLDGNAIAGTLYEYFGSEMTDVRGSCAHCKTTTEIAQLRVYNAGPGNVVRCPSCGSIVIVIVESARRAARSYINRFELTPRPTGTTLTVRVVL